MVQFTATRIPTLAAADDLTPGDSFESDGELYTVTADPYYAPLRTAEPAVILIPATRDGHDYLIHHPADQTITALYATTPATTR